MAALEAETKILISAGTLAKCDRFRPATVGAKMAEVLDGFDLISCR